MMFTHFGFSKKAFSGKSASPGSAKFCRARENMSCEPFSLFAALANCLRHRLMYRMQ